ncbi:WD40-repeat-containing domain protein [Zopfochytrium polystomum]|nr:WD40-repeat-containing domain protein [Zopfochytrium polystomum]
MIADLIADPDYRPSLNQPHPPPQYQHQHQSARSFLDTMPEEVLYRVLLHLATADFKSLARLSCASRRWSLRASSDSLWRALFLARWATPVPLADSPNILDRGQTSIQNGGGGGGERVASTIAQVPWKTFFRDRSALASFRSRARKRAGRLKDGHLSVVRGICVDAYSIVTAADDGKVKVWNRATKKCVLTIDASESSLRSVACHGSTIVCGTFDGEVKVLDAKAGVLEHTLRGLNDYVDFAHIDRELIVAAAGDRVSLWRRSTRTVLKTFVKHMYGSVDVHDGLLALSVSDDTVRVLRLPSGEVIYSRQFDSSVKMIQLENSILAVGCEYGVAAWTFNLQLVILSLHSGNVLVKSRIGSTVRMVIRDLSNDGKILRTIHPPRRNGHFFAGMILHTSGVMVGDAFGDVVTWDFDDGIPHAHEFMELKK